MRKGNGAGNEKRPEADKGEKEIHARMVGTSRKEPVLHSADQTRLRISEQGNNVTYVIPEKMTLTLYI